MTPIEILIPLALRAAILSVPVAVLLLAMRRLLLSETSNAWVYALTVCYAVFSLAGLLPWALGLAELSWQFLGLGMTSAPLWLCVVTVSGLGRSTSYRLSRDTGDASDQPGPPPLLLTTPREPEERYGPEPVFRHHRSRSERLDTSTERSVLAIARAMRGRASSEARRVRKLLPPPAPDASDLPFLR